VNEMIDGVTALIQWEKELDGSAPASAPAAAPGGGYTIYYHSACKGFLGRAWSPMLILEEAGAKYECKDASEKPDVVFAVPALLLPDGTQVGQTAVICIQLGKELGLWPSDDAKATQYCFDAADVLAEVFEKKPGERMLKWLQHLQAQIEASGGPFLFGEKLSAVDYTCFQGAFAARGQYADELEQCEKLRAWVTKMEEQKGFKAVDALKVPILPTSS